MKQQNLLQKGGALLLAVSTALSLALPAAAASDDDLDYYVGGISENGYLIDDDDNRVDFDEAVCGPAADSDLMVPYGKTIYFPLLNDGTSGEADWLYKEWQAALSDLTDEEETLALLERRVEQAKADLDAAAGAASGEELRQAQEAVSLLEEMLLYRKRLDRGDNTIDSGSMRELLADCADQLADFGVSISQDATQTQIQAEMDHQQAVIDSALSGIDPDAARTAWEQAVADRDAQQLRVNAAEQAALEAQRAYEDSVSGTTDGYPFVYESQAVKNVKIKTDWEEGKSYIDSLSITKKRYKNSPYAAPSGSRQYAYFLAIEIEERNSTSTSTRDVWGTVSLKKTSGSYRFDYDDVQVDVTFEIGYNHPEDANVIPINPALFEPDEDFDQDSDEEFEFEADDDSYYVANTNSQKKIVLGMDTDYDDEIGDRYDYANLNFWNGNGANFNRTGYLYLYADEDDYLYRIEDDGDLTLLHPDYDHYEDCFVIRTRTLGRYMTSDRRLPETADTAQDDEPDVTVIYDVDTGVNYNPTTGGYGADGDELWNAPAPADTTTFTGVMLRDGLMTTDRTDPQTAPEGQTTPEAQTADPTPEVSAAPTAALTGDTPLAPASPTGPADANDAGGLGQNTVILLCVLAAEITVALTSLICYFAFFHRRHD
ncbi:MAG: hypothetical protein DBX44_02960 [Oscillospiraceae bacterium]|nr:MAG: hypothetical protein DBX44_02960 [Oscillospiraceae bacterium]